MSRGILVRRGPKSKPFILYHWSPVTRRAGIEKRGLVVGEEHVAHTAGWNARYLCFSNSPSLAWTLSGDFCAQPIEWDLWMVWSSCIPGPIYRRTDHQGLNPAEFRTYVNIPKEFPWRVGSRTYDGRRKPR